MSQGGAPIESFTSVDHTDLDALMDSEITCLTTSCVVSRPLTCLLICSCALLDSDRCGKDNLVKGGSVTMGPCTT